MRLWPQPQRHKDTKGMVQFLLCLFVSLWLYLVLPVAVSAQEAAPVNGGWPAGVQYTVQPGDTLLTVSLELGLDVEQTACLLSRSFAWEQPLVIGDTLTVPERPFLCHQVQPGETLSAIAARYATTPGEIVQDPWNTQGGRSVRHLRIPLADDLPLPPLAIGGELAITSPPSAPLPLPAHWPYGSGYFAWPIYGWLSQGFRTGHSALDIAAWTDTPVTAADRGVVIRAGWSDIGYGNFVIIDHKIDYITLYAHLSEILVSEGQVVAQGQLIGRVGSTGNSTGPHLHFEIRDFGRRVDPLGLLSR